MDTLVHLESQQAALELLGKAMADPRGVALLHGRRSAGKRTLIAHFVKSLPPDMAVAIVDATNIRVETLLSAIIAQFGYDTDIESADDTFNILRMFAVQQAQASQPPLLVVDNADAISPAALRLVNQLAGIKVHDRYVLRLILVSPAPFPAMMNSPSMDAIRDRIVGVAELGPMTAREAPHYIHAKLRASGNMEADRVMSVEICDLLYQSSGGWPGILDNLTMRALHRAGKLPVRPEHLQHIGTPQQTVAADEQDDDGEVERKLVLTLDGRVIDEFPLDGSKTLIGRSELCDVCIGSRLISKVHALLLRNDEGTFLLDLNSRNGTTVNSRRARITMLRHEDIIALGQHRIKYIDPEARSRSAVDKTQLVDTTKMKNLTDARREAARDETRVVPVIKRSS